MDPSVCRLHPGVAVTGFCPACLTDRLAGLQPPSSADLRRCKSFSYARSAACQLEPQRRSCDLFRQEHEPPIIAVPEEEDHHQAVERRRMAADEPSRKSSFGGLLSKKLQQWRRKKKEEPPPPPSVSEMMPSRHHRQHSFRDLDGGRRSCDLQDLASWSGPGGPMFDHHLAPPPMLSVEEDCDMPAVPRSDGQIPVEEDYYYGDNNAVPGSCAQTRDYYLDSSSSSRRRRSVDRSTASGRNSFSDVNGEVLLPGRMMGSNANARVSPAMAAESSFYHAHHQSVLVQHHQYRRDWDHQPGLNYEFPGSRSFGSAFGRADKAGVPPQANNKPKKGIRGWSIWGLMQKKSSSSRKPEADHRSVFSSSAAAAGVGDQQAVEDYPWPTELRARGYNGQMLRCNSSISARSSFSGSAAAMIGGSARRSISGNNMEDVVHGSGRSTRRDEFLLERNLSTRSASYSRSGHDHRHPMGARGNYQFSKSNHNGVRSTKSKPGSALPRRSTLGPYSNAGPIPRQ